MTRHLSGSLLVFTSSRMALPRIDTTGEGGTLRQAEKALVSRVSGRLPGKVRARLLALVSADAADGDSEADPGLLALVKASANNVSLASMLTEISRLEAVRVIGYAAPPGQLSRPVDVDRHQQVAGDAVRVDRDRGDGDHRFDSPVAARGRHCLRPIAA
jgi:hypothetical protein